MNETQKRIKAYQKALPHMKERVVAVAMLLLIAVSMMVSATFAWVTLSVNPEVSGLATTLAANGNLEIALSNFNGTAPNATAVGDGLAVVTESNLKWGNLINLSHESYGLDSLTLRPASLNTEGLNTSPMIAVNYGQDGRVEGYLKDFAFSSYNGQFFEVFDEMHYGVRAISSVTFSNKLAESFYTNQLDKITESMENAKKQFSDIYNNDSYMNTVTALVGIHVSAYMGTDDISCLSHMTNLNKIMDELVLCSDTIGQALVDIANMYLYDELVDDENEGAYDSLAYDLDDLKATNYSNSFVTKYSREIKGLSAYITMAKKVDAAVTGIENAQKNEDGDVLWKRDLEKPIKNICDMDTATLNGYTTRQLSNSYGTAFKILTASETPLALIKDGALKDIDQILGTELYVGNVKVGVTLPSDFGYGMSGRTITLTVNVKTTAAAPFALPVDYNDAYNFSSTATDNDRGKMSAADTYAMAIDFWVRTNEENALLMLEGEVDYRIEIVPITGTDVNGVEVPLYELEKTITSESGKTDKITVEVYQVVTGSGDSATVTWYNALTHAEEQVGTATPTAKTKEEKTPIGYSGVNRVWDELDDPNSDYSQLIQGGTSTTQGSGSCYIFYPETPEDQEQSKELLQAMRVAFVDQNGKLLGNAEMDTDNLIEDGGRVIVPLKMRLQANPIVVGKDKENNDITESYYVTPMTQNEAMRITAIIYLDGKNLSNNDVLSAGSINGQLNIQFGLNKMDNEPLKSGDLMKEYYSIVMNLIHKETGEAAKLDNSMTAYDPDNDTWDLEMTMEGTDASTVRGQFVSFINSSQGVRQDEFTLTYDETERKWKGTATFEGPGDFRLRSIEIDGVDILLPTDQVLRIVIPGKGVSAVTCTNWGGEGKSQSIMTADASYKQEVLLTLSSSDNQISAVQGVFIGDNGKNVTVDFVTDGGVNYTGTANFTAGGTYKLTYVIIDGVYTPLNENLYKTLTVKLNLKTTVVLGLPVDQGYYDLRDEMEEALEAAATQEEKDALLKEYEERISEYLDLLHYGTGIPGDANEKGLSLQRDNDGNMSLITDCSKPLFMDVRCIITDDQGNILAGLSDVELLYSTGGLSNVLDSDVLEEDSAAGYYFGRFTLESNGLFSFQNVTFKDNGRSYTIYSAISAPTVTAIQPSPMEYVTQDAYAPYVYDLGRSENERVLYIKLKNAAAATLDVTLVDANNEPYQEALTVTASEPDANNVTTFAVKLPSDGFWKIDGLRAKNVFYDGTFYTGTEDPTTWLNLTQEVRDDVIATTYITEAYIRVNGNTPAQQYNGQFMQSHTVTGMNVEVLGDVYGELYPLETILKANDIKAEVSFSLQYALDQDTIATASDSYTYTLASGGSLPQNVFTSSYDDANHKATIASMNFLLPGTYYPTWTVTIDDADNRYDFTYTYQLGGQKPQEFTYLNTQAMERVTVVTWTELPAVHISEIAPSGNHSAVYYSFSLFGNSWKSTTATSQIHPDSNNHTATVYAEMKPYSYKGASMEQYPLVKLQLSNKGSAEGATMTFTASSTVLLYPGTNREGRVDYFEWSGTATTAQRYVGTYDWGELASVTPAGTLTSNQLVMKYGDMTFTFTLSYTITIHNLAGSK